MVSGRQRQLDEALSYAGPMVNGHGACYESPSTKKSASAVRTSIDNWRRGTLLGPHMTLSTTIITLKALIWRPLTTQNPKLPLALNDRIDWDRLSIVQTWRLELPPFEWDVLQGSFI